MRKSRNVVARGQPHDSTERARLRRPLIRIMKMIPVLLMSLVSATCVQSFAAQDAATEAQEGAIDHWIEYYTKQRAIGNETVTEQAVPRETEPSDAGTAQSGTHATQPPDPRSDD